MNLKIERGVPLPDRTDVDTKKFRGLLAKMAVGESVYITGTRLEWMRYRHEMYLHNAVGERRFTSRMDGDGLRFWRIK